MDATLRSFFGFQTSPFGPLATPVPQIHLASRHALIDDAVAAVMTGRTVITFAGERGAGKTTLIDAIATEFKGRQILTIPISSTVRRPIQLQQVIAAAFGIEGDLGLEPQQWICAGRREDSGQTAVLLVDNAEMLTATILRYLWLLIQLSDFGTTKLHLVLAGGLGRWPGLEYPDLAELRHRGDPRVIIMPLDDDEAAAYLDWKLWRAGGSRQMLMTHAALADLLERACGVPGRLNALAESALVYAYQKRRRRIIAPVLPAAASGEADMILPCRDVHPGWRSVSIVAFLLIVAVGVSAALGLPSAPALNARMSAHPDRGVHLQR